MLVIKGGHVIDPGNVDGVYDIYIRNGHISALVDRRNGESKTGQPEAVDSREIEREINAEGKIVTPGLIDMHVHLREPGYEYKETIATGSLAAAAGGFAAVCCMPNTKPVNDCAEVTRYIIQKAEEAGFARVFPVGAISRASEGKALADFGELKAAGAVAVTDDGRPVSDSRLMRRAMEYATGFGLPVISHCEDIGLAENGVMNEGPVATRLGLAGIPNAAETVMVMRDIVLSALTGAHVHIAHVSTAESVSAIRSAKRQGLTVTAETAPHYFTLTDEAVGLYNTNAKMNPPLRSETDRQAIREGLADGTIDVIATDHAPHSILEKEVEFDQAANGIIGLETSLALSLALVRDKILDFGGLVNKMAKNPARILGLACGIKVNSPADLTILDPRQPIVVEPGSFHSLGRNTPFGGISLQGRVLLTMVGGRIVFSNL
ncbi:MAG: dihydroorotase [Thermodesulfobacteriota bacterium]